MPLSRDSRQERKLKAVRRAQFRLKQTIERIDWEEDSLLPEVEALKSGRSILGLPENSAFDIEVQFENSHPQPATDHQPTNDSASQHQRSRARTARARR